MLSFFLLLVTVSLIFYHCVTHYGRTGKLVNKIPGPTVLPFLGNAWQFIGPLDEFWTALRKNHAKYYPINRIWLGGMPTISVYHPDDVQIVLTSTKHIEKSKIYSFLRPWLGTGLLTSTGEKWQKRRRMLTRAFHFEILQEFAEVFVEQSGMLIRNLKSEGNGVVMNIVPLVTKFTLDSICETAMGTGLHDNGNENKYRDGVLEMGNHVVNRLVKPWLHEDWIFKLTPTGFRQRKVLENVHTLTNEIIADRKNYLEENAAQTESLTLTKKGPNDDDVKEKRMAMLDILIDAAKNGGHIDDIGIREEVDTFVFEGHDTTAMGVTFAIALLAEHKDIQERARKEVCEVMEKSGGKLGMTEINKLLYLDRCIKESLRLYPSVPVITRKLNEDLQLKNYSAPAGSNIHVYIFDLQRDPNYWPDPLKYNPDRFLPENSWNRHPFSYVPFSGGPRNCIGQKFAMLELKILLAQLLYNFNFEAIDLAHEVALFQDLVIRTAQPVRVKFFARNKENSLESPS